MCPQNLRPRVRPAAGFQNYDNKCRRKLGEVIKGDCPCKKTEWATSPSNNRNQTKDQLKSAHFCVFIAPNITGNGLSALQNVVLRNTFWTSIKKRVFRWIVQWLLFVLKIKLLPMAGGLCISLFNDIKQMRGQGATWMLCSRKILLLWYRYCLFKLHKASSNAVNQYQEA